MFLRLSVLFLITGVLAACGHGSGVRTSASSEQSKQMPAFNLTLIDSGQSIIQRDEITELSVAQTEHFLAHFNNPVFQNTPPHERVASYLGIVLDRFEYSEQTLPARTALETFTGNCLSLAVISKAFARLANVDIEFQMLSQNPVYSISGDVLVTSDHIRSVLRGEWTHNKNELFGSQSQIRIDYFPTDGLSYVGDISAAHMTSLFYSNVAAESVVDGELDRAFAHASTALSIDPENTSALNTMGIVHRRLGDYATAEKIYRWGAQFPQQRAVFLQNLLVVLDAQARAEEAKLIEQEITLLQSNSPWQWVRKGREALQHKDYLTAAKAYERAIEIAPDLHQVYADAAIANYHLGRNRIALKHLRQAMHLADDETARGRYQQKLTALQQ